MRGRDHYIIAEDKLALIDAISAKARAEGRMTNFEEDIQIMAIERTLAGHLHLAAVDAQAPPNDPEWEAARQHKPEVSAEALAIPKMKNLPQMQEEQL